MRQGYERVYYTKDDETDSLEITSREAAYIIDVNEEEKRALDVLHKINENTYEKVDEKFTALQENVDELKQNVEEFSQKNEEQAGQISTLEQEKADMAADLDKVKEEYANAQEQLQTLTEENTELNTYKHDVILEQKKAVIDRYSELLNEEVLDTYRAKIEDMDTDDLEKELAFTLVQTKPTLFSNEERISGRAPKDDTPEEGIAGILSRYTK